MLSHPNGEYLKFFISKCNHNTHVQCSYRRHVCGLASLQNLPCMVWICLKCVNGVWERCVYVVHASHALYHGTNHVTLTMSSSMHGYMYLGDWAANVECNTQFTHLNGNTCCNAGSLHSMLAEKVVVVMVARNAASLIAK